MAIGPDDTHAVPADLSSVVDALATAIIVLDEQLAIRYLNPAAELLLGISLKRAQDKHSARLLPGNPEFEAELHRVLSSGDQSVRRELKIHIAPAVMRIVDCRISQMDHNAPKGLLVELLDAEPRLQINREIALLTQQSVGRDITAQLAHEIRNPLGGLRGAAQLLRRQLDSPDLHQYTDVIIEEADRLANLVNTMLGPHAPANKKPANIHKHLHRVYELLVGESTGAIEIIEDYDPSLPELMLDGDLITQACLNIGRNAIQMLPAGGTLRLRTRAETQYMLRGRRYPLVARIDFEDNGPGVAEEVRETLFYPLITARSGGTGLGLALAQDLINRHDGLIQLRNAGAPTIFSIYLPA